MKTVLVIEDEPNILELIRINLERGGFRVQTAAAGEDGLALARRERPDLVILDLRLPDLDGGEVCRRLKNEPALGGIPVLIVTASVQKTTRDLADRAGADFFLKKPFDPAELLAAVRRLLGDNGTGGGPSAGS